MSMFVRRQNTNFLLREAKVLAGLALQRELSDLEYVEEFTQGISEFHHTRENCCPQAIEIVRKEEVRSKVRSESSVARLKVAKQVATEMMVRNPILQRTNAACHADDE